MQNYRMLAENPYTHTHTHTTERERERRGQGLSTSEFQTITKHNFARVTDNIPYQIKRPNTVHDYSGRDVRVERRELCCNMTHFNVEGIKKICNWTGRVR
jgi:hypothetical protein